MTATINCFRTTHRKRRGGFPPCLGLAAVLLVASPGAAVCQTLRIAQVGNAGVVLSDGATTLLVDLPHVSGAFGYASYPKEGLDISGEVVVVVTHEHADHFDAAALARRADWRVIGPPAVIRRFGSGRAVQGNPVSVGSFWVQAIPTPHTPDHRSYRLAWRGREIYVAGDTEDAEAVLARSVDVLFLTPWLACRLSDEGRTPGAAHVVVYHLRPDGTDRACGLGEPTGPQGIALHPLAAGSGVTGGGA